MKSPTDLYDDSYRKFTPEWFEDQRNVNRYLIENRESIMDFIRSYCQQFNKDLREFFKEKQVLDAGCGLGAVAFGLDSLGANVTAVDISKLAIIGAKSIKYEKGSGIDFKCANLADESLILGEFDYVIDSHLMHCLIDQNQRDKYLAFILNNLKPGGLYFLETMVYQNSINIPIDYHLDENLVLHKFMEDQNSFVPIRKLIDSMVLEKEIKSSGLSLDYFYYHAELGFQAFPEYKNYPIHQLPHTVRAVTSKKTD